MTVSNTTKQFKQRNQRSAEELLGKQLPASVDAEKAVLGSILLSDENYNKVADILAAKDFYLPAHRVIFEIITDLIKKFKRIDLVTLQDELAKKERLEDVGGIVYLVALQENISAVGLVEQHAQIVHEKSVLREMIRSATDIISNCYKQDQDDIAEVLDFAEKTIFQIANRQSRDNFVQLNIWLKKTFQHLSEIKSHAKGITGIPTGFANLDDMTSGMQKSDLIILAGRPSMGKTALALNMTANAAFAGYKVGFFSLEMAAEQLTLRMLSTASGIEHHKIRNATINSDEWVELTNVAAQMAKQHIFIDDTPGINLMELRARARKLKMEHGVDMIVIDYLQLLYSGKRHENRHQEVSEISRSLKGLAKELGVPVIAGSQLSRAVDSRMDKRPMLSDLRESGAIEQDADLIMFLYRDIVYNQDTDTPDLAELIIGKQRNGATGTVELRFAGEYSRFDDYA